MTARGRGPPRTGAEQGWGAGHLAPEICLYPSSCLSDVEDEAGAGTTVTEGWGGGRPSLPILTLAKRKEPIA